MKRIKKIIIWFFIFCFLATNDIPVYAYTLIPEYLCEMGLKLYKQGYINDALREFDRALIANPEYAPALKYRQMIQERLAEKRKVPVSAPAPLVKPTVKPVVEPTVKPLIKPAVVQPPAKPLPEKLPLPKLLPKPEEKEAVIPEPAPELEEKEEVVFEPLPKLVEEEAIDQAMARSKLKEAALVMPAPLPKKQPEVMPKPVLPAAITPAAILKRESAMEKAMEKLEKALPKETKKLSAPPAKPLPEKLPLPKPLPKPEKKKEIITAPVPGLKDREKTIEQVMGSLKKTAPVIIPAPLPKKQPEVMPKPVLPVSEEIKELSAPQALILDESTRALTTALEIEQGRAIVIAGHNIQRFLLTQTGVLSIERQGSDELLVTARDFGYTYLHVWDDNGRWTLEFLTVPVKPTGPTYEDILRRSEERANSFKLRYTMDWNSFYASPDGKFSDLKRSSYSFGHYLYLNGPTPYGDIDSNVSIRTLKASTDLTYLTLGLTKGKIGPFEDFSLRAVDFSPSVNNLAMSSPTLRGVMLESPAFHKTLDYTLFWGREGGGSFGGLSPGLAKSRNSFLSGISADYFYNENQKYGFSVFRGWGRDRPTTLNPYGYDSYVNFKLGKWDTRYELGYDSEKLAHLFTTKYELPKLKISEEIRNIDKRFVTMTGSGWRVGELGSLTALYYTPMENLDIDGRLDIFRDRLFPNPDSPDRWNMDFRTDLAWRLDPLTSIRSDYSFLNDKGRVSSYQSLNTGLGLYKTFEWPRRISTYVNYRHQEDKHYNSPKLNYTDEKVTMGLRFALARDLYYFLNRELNWLHESFTGNNSRPEVFETGMDWSSQILKSPFYGSMRLLYRDEENTGSTLSFLSGEDYVEGYGTISYRPQPDQELYCSARLRKIWPDNASVSKRIEVDFNAGLRYMWDTGVRWEPIGSVEGYVFKDLNSDGLREEQEQPLEGVRLWLGKKSTTTDTLGYYKFEKIRARKAYVNLDTQTLPSGFVLTVPVTQEVGVLNHKGARLDFGVISRSEIWGVVFVDVNGDGEFNLNKGDKGIKGVLLVLENGLKAMTDGSGQYRFANTSVGEHTVTLDLNTLPVEYLPTVPLKKTVIVFEGVSYNYNIPARLSNK